MQKAKRLEILCSGQRVRAQVIGFMI